MNTLSADAQNFYDKFCAPVFNKYQKDDAYIVSTPGGDKYFDVQLAMLSEAQTFSPVTDSGDRVIAFFVKGQPQYVFADDNYMGDKDAAIPGIFPCLMERFVQSGEATKIATYHGFRHITVSHRQTEEELD